MKKLIIYMLIASSPLFSQELQWENAVFDIENTPSFYLPFAIAGEYINIQPSSFSASDLNDSNVSFAQWDFGLAYTHPINCVSGLIFGAGYIGVDVNMEENPSFDETQFHYVNFSIGAFTQAFPDWLWTLTVAVFLDTANFSLANYALYQSVLWGRYQICPCVEFDIGLIAEVGLRKEKVWPIIGFTYTPCPQWRINAVYPIQLSIEYDILPCLTAAGSLRFLRTRHRVGDNEPDPQGIFEYRTGGAEFDLIFAPYRWMSIKGFAGKTFDRDFIISNLNGHNETHYQFHSAFYAGVSAILNY